MVKESISDFTQPSSQNSSDLSQCSKGKIPYNTRSKRTPKKIVTKKQHQSAIFSEQTPQRTYQYASFVEPMSNDSLLRLQNPRQDYYQGMIPENEIKTEEDV